MPARQCRLANCWHLRQTDHDWIFVKSPNRTRWFRPAGSAFEKSSPQLKGRLVPQVSVVLPVHNQEDHISDILRSFHSSLNALKISFELIVVTNGCRDKSNEMVEELTKILQSVRLLSLADSGWGRAVLAGLRESRGEWIVYTNTARTTGSQLAEVVQHALSGKADVVKYRRLNRGWHRGIQSLMFNLICRVLFGLRSWDINGTPKAFHRRNDQLLRLTREDNLVDLEFMICCRKAKFHVVEIDGPWTDRHGGKSTTRWNAAWPMLFGLLTMWSTECGVSLWGSGGRNNADR